MSPKTMFRVVLVVALMLLTSGISWAQQRVSQYAWAACQDAKTAVCVSRASQTRYPSGMVHGRTPQDNAVESCLMGYNHRLPELERARRRRVLVDLFGQDPNKATAQAMQACLTGVLTARVGTIRWTAVADAQFQAQRLAARTAASVNAVAVVSNQPPAPSSPPPSAGAPIEAPKADPATERAIGQLDKLGQDTNAVLHGPDDNSYVDAPAPVVSHGTGPSSLGDDLVLLYANDREAAVYVKKNGQFYTIRTSSFLANKYDTDWANVYTYSGNEYRDMFGACFQGRKITLDQDRRHVKAWDATTLNGPVNTAFKEQCERDGGEFRFALQAGQIIKIPAKGAGSASVAPVPPPATVSAAPVAPTVLATPSASPTMSTQPPETDAAVAVANKPEDAGVSVAEAGVTPADAAAMPTETDSSVTDTAPGAANVTDAAQSDASDDAGTSGTTGKSVSWENVILPFLYIMTIALSIWILLETGRRLNRLLKKRRGDDDSGDDGDGTPPPTGGGGSSDPPAPSTPPPAAMPLPSPRPKLSGFRLWWRTLKAWWEVKREEWRTGVPYVPPTIPPPTFRTVDVTPPPPAPTGFDDDDPADDSGGSGSLDDPDTDDPDTT